MSFEYIGACSFIGQALFVPKNTIEKGVTYMTKRTLSEEAIQARRDYYKAWRDKPENKIKAQIYQKNYWSRRGQEAEPKESAS